MAFSGTLRCPPSICRLSNSTPSVSSSSASFRFSPSIFNSKRPLLSIRSASVEAPPTSGALVPAISLTDNALKHFNKLRTERSEDLCLRIGVKQGGCSGMSYTMDFENRENARPDDSIIKYNGFVIDAFIEVFPLSAKLIHTTVCDPKSLLFLYGMQLDYSDALIGGGFNFKNPNATQTCGCGKSFAAEM
ncbi:iron-sulfur assembly protein IscA, chloroplastic-like [Olea europaea var. sylvestris]|uniref:iron-sulfur assembly protein IscA, chloroplastic-like n=1 Tax=Olea europaea var. sylvestris TaxID=158386 RepID=UPI000C1D8487|nr:iron-sulfur assembly protein IscA, chloroplastic-like [Olea europaea var. sylvestris]